MELKGSGYLLWPLSGRSKKAGLLEKLKIKVNRRLPGAPKSPNPPLKNTPSHGDITTATQHNLLTYIYHVSLRFYNGILPSRYTGSWANMTSSMICWPCHQPGPLNIFPFLPIIHSRAWLLQWMNEYIGRVSEWISPHPTLQTGQTQPLHCTLTHMDNAVQAAVLARMLSNVLLWMVSAAKCILAGPPAKIPQYHSKKKM